MDTNTFITEQGTEIHAYPGKRCGIFKCRRDMIEYEAPQGAYKAEVEEYCPPPDGRRETMRRLASGSATHPPAPEPGGWKEGVVYSRMPWEHYLQIKLVQPDDGLIKTKEELRFTLNWDGTIRAESEYLTGPRPTPEQKPLIAAYLKEVGVEWVDYFANREELMRSRNYDKFCQAHPVTQEREQELLAWLYAQGWEQHPPAMKPVEIFEIPIASFSADYTCTRKPTLALVAAYTAEAAEGWRQITAVEMRASAGWGPRTSLCGENLPAEYVDGFSRPSGNGESSRETWELWSFGTTREEADALRAVFEKVDEKSGTGAILLPGRGLPGTNLVG